MSDRTSHTLIVHQTTPEGASAFLNVIEEYGLDEFGPDADAGDVVLGEKYMCDEHPVGGSTDAATYLEKHAPNSVWTVWEDPKYEWLGIGLHPRSGTRKLDGRLRRQRHRLLLGG
jgi:hypothetical protein